MFKKSLSLAALCLTLLLQACGGGDVVPLPSGDPQAYGCSPEAQRGTLMSWMDDLYYWNDNRRPADLAAPDMATFFSSMVDPQKDRYSYTQSTESFKQVFTSGWRVGYGYALAVDADGSLRVRNVEPLSAVAAAGMRRGDRIVSIDGFTPKRILEGALPVVTTEGVMRHFVLAGDTGAQRNIDVHSRLYQMQPLATWKVLDATRNGQPVKVGYLVYNQFVFYHVNVLAFVVQHMVNAGVGEIVLDLRYNGGGSVTTARDLASFVSGSMAEGQVFTHMKFNERYRDSDVDVKFLTAGQRYAQPLENMKRVFVITSGSTASASELLINGLKPFTQVVLVGDTTYGKPYGFIPRDACGTIFNAVNFETVNALGVGGFDAGIPVDCKVADDLDHPLGDANEGRLKAALRYIETGTCSATAQTPMSAAVTSRSPPRVYGETVPAQMFYMTP